MEVSKTIGLPASGYALYGGDKSGGSEKRFYGQLIDKADDRFDAHLSVIQKQKQQEKKKRK